VERAGVWGKALGQGYVSESSFPVELPGTAEGVCGKAACAVPCTPSSLHVRFLHFAVVSDLRNICIQYRRIIDKKRRKKEGRTGGEPSRENRSDA
jgi:hypothetical protein